MPVLAEAERKTLRLLCDTFAPRLGDEGIDRFSASDLRVPELFEEAQASQPAEVVRSLRRFLRILESRTSNLALTGSPRRFSSLGSRERERYLLAWGRSRIAVKRQAFHAVKRLTVFLFYSALDSEGRNPTWGPMRYDGPSADVGGRHRRAELDLPSLRPERETTLECDAVVVGSGAGGSVVAADLTRAGHRVLVVEAGGNPRPAGFAERELPGTDGTFEWHGLLATRDLAIGVLTGRTAGGSTTVNWMTCLRPPDHLLKEWEVDHGIPGLRSESFRADVDRVWDRIGANTAESVVTAVSDVLLRGCRALGYREDVDYHTTPKNARGCANRCDFCNWGCPYDAKQSSLVTFLPDAAAHGARFLFDTPVDRIVIERGRATGVEATFRGTGSAVPVRIRARVVVAAGGAIQTPALLLRSGVRHRALGHGIHIHPTTAVGGEYAKPVRMWSGVPQTVHVDRFANLDGRHHGVWMETVPAHPGLTALGLPWRGAREHRRLMSRYAHTAATIVLVRDRTAGRVTLGSDREPRLDYVSREPDRRHLVRGIQESIRIHAAAGATRITTLHTETLEVASRGDRIAPSDLDRLLDDVARAGVRPNALALFTAHLMGGCAMGLDDGRHVAGPRGALHDVPNVFVADGSVFPSAAGVNPMVSIMAMAARTSAFVDAALRDRAAKP